jgi:hypothetical protein
MGEDLEIGFGHGDYSTWDVRGEFTDLHCNSRLSSIDNSDREDARYDGSSRCCRGATSAAGERDA